MWLVNCSLIQHKVTVVNLKYLTERNTKTLGNIWFMRISTSSVCRWNRIYFHRKGKKLILLSFFLYKWVMHVFISKEKKYPSILLSLSLPFFIKILHHNLSRKHFLASNQVFPLAFSIEIHSHGTILLSLSYISIRRQFTEETQFEFSLHLVTLNWT